MQEKNSSHAATLILFMAAFGAARGNPVSIGPESFSQPIQLPLAGAALAMEVAVVSLILVIASKVEQWRLFAGLVAALNLVTYITFIVFLHAKLRSIPIAGSVPFIEVMIWLVESLAMIRIVRVLGAVPVKPSVIVGVVLLGNLLSLVFGLVG